MLESKKIDLSKVFRPHLAQSRDEISNMREQLMVKKCQQIESRSSALLIDKKYVVNLDELV